MTKKIGGHLDLGEGLQVTNFDQCLHIIMVIGKCTVVFRGFFWFWGWGCGEGAMWEDLSLEKYVMGEQKFNEKGAGFSKITIKKNNEKINMEKFFPLKARSTIET